MRVSEFCKNYFNPSATKLSDQFSFNSVGAARAAKILSYATIICPLIMGIVYGMSKAIDRDRVKEGGPFPAPKVKQVAQVLVQRREKQQFANINSACGVDLKGNKNSNDFEASHRKGKWPAKPVIAIRPSFVPDAFVEHFAKNKRAGAIGEKYKPNTKITNMEGALHTFVTFILPTTLAGDPGWDNGYVINRRPDHLGREVVLSTAIQPDFESRAVLWDLLHVSENSIQGESVSADFKPLAERFPPDSSEFREALPNYEDQLKRHMISFLTEEKRIPGSNEEGVEKLEGWKAMQLIRHLIEGEVPGAKDLKNVVLSLGQREEFCLEALFNLVLEQIRYELSALDQLLPQGYVYSIDPPKIFTRYLGDGGTRLLNHLQVFALRCLRDEGAHFQNLKCIAFNNFEEFDSSLDLMQKVFHDRGVEIISKKELYDENGNYKVPANMALVIHNNSDAFGQNIQSEEGKSSLDATVGQASDAAVSLNQETVQPIVMSF